MFSNGFHNSFERQEALCANKLPVTISASEDINLQKDNLPESQESACVLLSHLSYLLQEL